MARVSRDRAAHSTQRVHASREHARYVGALSAFTSPACGRSRREVPDERDAPLRRAPLTRASRRGLSRKRARRTARTMRVIMSTTTLPTHREVANRGLLVVSVMLATLMQALDTTIANVALPNMQGSLSATQDQISWVLTSYIVAAAIATPATGWLASVMGRRRLLLIAIAGFTVASVLCGMASSIGAMVAFRLLQGLFGAALVPLSQSTLLDVYPREKHGAAMALWGMGVMVGPILGPPLGGWLTDVYSWHWVFLINVPIGALALFGVAASLPTDETRESRFDWRGFAFLAIGIGALQLFLDRGEQQDWFGSVEIQIEAALAFLGFYLYFVHWKTRERAFSISACSPIAISSPATSSSSCSVWCCSRRWRCCRRSCRV